MFENKTIAESTIRVDWSMQSPGITPSRWFEFHSTERPASPAQLDLERNLAWPEGTLAALEEGFQNRLGRNTGWKLDGLQNKTPYLVAARIYKRGVLDSQTTPKLLSGSYKVILGDSVPLFENRPEKSHFIVDKNVQAHWQLTLRPSDQIFELKETTKSLTSVANLLQGIRSNEGPIFIVGGGILADAAAFAAAMENRPFTLVPTTLLAMVDACVGGKTGVNSEVHGKNQIGLFAFPTKVIVDAKFLKSLDRRELKAGLAESYKHALIAGDPTFTREIANLDFSPQSIKRHLYRLIKVKADIIAEDPNETGRRATLNFGHTLAHALEKISQEKNPKDPILHGEAIGIGMRFAALLSHELGLLSKKVFTTIQDELRSANFMISSEDFRKHMGVWPLSFEAVMEGIFQDKKNTGDEGETEWVLLKDYGLFAEKDGRFTVPLKTSTIKKTWETFVTQERLY